MLINCPLKNKSEVIPLIKAGADTFYAGLSDEILFGFPKGIANRRPWKFANFRSLAEFNDSLNLIHEYNKNLFLTINEHFYSQKQVNQIVKFISEYPTIDGCFVTDINLMIELKKRFPDVYLIASTCTHIQNKNAIDFYLNLDVSEIVIPRHFRISEIKELILHHPNLKFECFIKNQDCANIDGLCGYSHGIFDTGCIRNACRQLNNFKIRSRAKNEDIKLIVEGLDNYKSIMFNECGVCSIWDLSKLGITRVKIVGRSLPLKDKLRDVLFIKKAISNLNLSKNSFINKVRKDYRLIYGRKCNYKCFYDF